MVAVGAMATLRQLSGSEAGGFLLILVGRSFPESPATSSSCGNRALLLLSRLRAGLTNRGYYCDVDKRQLASDADHRLLSRDRDFSGTSSPITSTN